MFCRTVLEMISLFETVVATSYFALLESKTGTHCSMKSAASTTATSGADCEKNDGE